MSLIENQFQNYLDDTIHDTNHLQTVYERMDYVTLLKEAVAKNNPGKAKEAVAAFYKYIKLDHQTYSPPEDLLAAAIGRTHFFHGLVYGTLLERLAPSVFAYSLSLAHIESINQMPHPEDAFGLTCDLIDTYCAYITSLERHQTGAFSTKVLNLIDLNMQQELNTSILAKHLHLHPDYLQKKFKQETGRNITDMINERRVELAKIYLRNPKYSITQVAYEVGFSDASYFGKVFRKLEGMTPGQYKKRG